LNLLTNQPSIGLSVAGENLILVEASMRADQARWSTRRIERFFAEGVEPSPVGGVASDATVVLVWPTDHLLRRDVALGEQALDDLKAAVGESPDAFFPVSRDEGLLWDAHEFTDEQGARRAMLFGLRLRDAEPALARLAQAGVTPTRLVPSAAAWSVLRFAHQHAPDAVLEFGAKSWAVSEYDGLRWNALRTGFGAAQAELRERARRDGWGVCDWRSAPARVGESSVWRPDELTPEHAALAGALLDLAHDADLASEGIPTIDLLSTPSKRSLRIGALGWFAAACAAVVIGLLSLNNAANARAQREASLLAGEVARLRPSVERVDALRAQADAVIKAHERLATLENSYRPITGTLAELSLATPKGAHFVSVEFADSGLSAMAIAASRSELMAAIEASPMFQGVAPTSGSTRLPTGGEQFGLAFGFERAPAPAQGGGE
jgi:Tfp pilus assembly protein PilN